MGTPNPNEVPNNAWNPVAELKSLDNQAYFADILPRLQTVQVIKGNNDLPTVIELNGGHIVAQVDGQKLKRQQKLIATDNPVQAFAPLEIPVDAEAAPEEALVRSLHLSLIHGALGTVSSRSATFDAASEDIRLLLGSLSRPTHHYRQLSEKPRYFMDRYMSAAHASRHLKAEQLAFMRQAISLTVYNAVVDPPQTVRNFLPEASPEEVQLIDAEEQIPTTTEEAVELPLFTESEVELPPATYLEVFLEEFRFDRTKLPGPNTAAIRQAKVSESNLMASKFSRERMSRLGITAYIETLAFEANQSGKDTTAVDSILRLITEDEDAATAKVVKLANALSRQAQEQLGQKDATPVDANEEQLSVLPIRHESLPQAFSILRLFLTERGIKRVAEGPTSRQLGDLVVEILHTAYPLKADFKHPAFRSD